jgi:hypothetical protein
VSRQSFVLAVILTLAPGIAAAQDAPAFRPGQVIFSGGGTLEGGYRIGDLTVTIPRNPSGGPTPFTLLRAESRIGRSVGIDARLAFALSRAVAIEVRGAYGTPELGVTVSQDDEMGTGAFASGRVQQFVVDVSAIYQLPIAAGRRARTYAIGGAGYLRQLHEGRLQAETGQTVHVGGGLQYWLRGAGARAVRPARPASRALGVRAEARYVTRFGGVEFEDNRRGFPAMSALLFVAF